MALAQLEPGTVFAQDYRILSFLSQGGMGAVYLVEQESTGAQRALKIMLPQIVSDPRHRRRFEQEARIGSRIESDHVVQVISAGVDAATGTPWLAMELLRGEDLATVMSTRGPLPVGVVSAILQQACHALGAAHRVGIVHRDLKPENIFVCAARRADAHADVKILDFGIARLIAEAFTGTSNIGSPLWMAPEQTSQGEVVGPGADVWSLGLLAFHLLTGIYFWHAANTDAPLGALLREIVLSEIPSATQRAAEYGVDHLIPRRFDEWFAQCLARDPKRRFENASIAFAVFWAVLHEPVAPTSAPGGEEDMTVVDFSDQTTTLSSIPPAAPWRTDDGEEVTFDDRPGAHGPEWPITANERPSSALLSEIARHPWKFATGPGTTRSTTSPGAFRRRATVGGIALALAASAAVFLLVKREPPKGTSAARPSPGVAEARALLPAPATPASTPPPGLRVNSVRIPAGSFTMGSPENGDAGLKLMLDAFEIDRTEVTVREWKMCERAGACPSLLDVSLRTSPRCNLPYGERIDHPINCVAWSEARGYCAWTGGRLPTEEEWEYAAAAGREGRVNLFPWGAEPNPLNANGEGDVDGYLFTAPVGRFPRGASDFAILDMAGNVEEWTSSAYAPHAVEGMSAPGDADRVTRGGSYESDARTLRPARRGRAPADTRAPTLGFRCAGGVE